MYRIRENEHFKFMVSEDVKYMFNKRTGFSVVWGKTENEDPDWCPHGPLIADIEITTSCKGPGGMLCGFCYKSNNPFGKYMCFNTFEKLFDKLPDTLQQIAFGVDAQCESNPDTFKIMKHCRDNGVIPNVTVADISEDTADKLSQLCGAVAVSRYEEKDYCYDSVKMLTDRGMDQVNIHLMVSEETYEQAIETVVDIEVDERLDCLNAIVFLSLKQKGRGTGYNTLSQKKFKNIVDLCTEKNIKYGFDSCSAHKFLESVKDFENYKELNIMTEPCESTLFSLYIDVNGDLYPCSFCEDIDGWGDGISVLDCDDFIDDVWNNPRVKKFRDGLIGCNRNCPIYDI